MTPLQTAELIAEVTNLKILEVYREADTQTIDEAKETDDHLDDLSRRIIIALDLLGQDSFTQQINQFGKRWAQLTEQFEKRQAQVWGDIEEIETSPVIDPDPEDNQPDMGKTDKVLKKMLNTPPGEPKNSAAPIEAEKSPRDKSQTPIDGGELDTKKSNESPAAENATESEKTGVDDMSGSAGSGADPDPNQVMKDDERLTTRLRAFKNKHHLSNMRIAKLTGCSDYTICAITNGKHVSDVMCIKVLAAIEKYKPKGDQVQPTKKHNGVGGRGAAEFIQAKLRAWLEAEDLDASSASEALRVSEHALLSILKGHLPHSNVVFELAKYIPEIKVNQDMLLAAAAEQQEAT